MSSICSFCTSPTAPTTWPGRGALIPAGGPPNLQGGASVSSHLLLPLTFWGGDNAGSSEGLELTGYGGSWARTGAGEGGREVLDGLGSGQRTRAPVGQQVALWRNLRRGCDLELPIFQVAFDGLVMGQHWDSEEVEVPQEGRPRCSLGYLALQPGTQEAASEKPPRAGQARPDCAYLPGDRAGLPGVWFSGSTALLNQGKCSRHSACPGPAS